MAGVRTNSGVDRSPWSGAGRAIRSPGLAHEIGARANTSASVRRRREVSAFTWVNERVLCGTHSQLSSSSILDPVRGRSPHSLPAGRRGPLTPFWPGWCKRTGYMQLLVTSFKRKQVAFLLPLSCLPAGWEVVAPAAEPKPHVREGSAAPQLWTTV